MEKINVFIASGSDLAQERKEIHELFHRIEKQYEDLHLSPEMWETAIPSGSYDGKKVQEAINPFLEECEIVLVLFHSKVGRFTLEEFDLAERLNKKLFVYFKTGVKPTDQAATKSLLEVLELKEIIQKKNTILTRDFETLDQFKKDLADDLRLYFKDRPTGKKAEDLDFAAEPLQKFLTPIPRYHQDNLIGRKGLLAKLHGLLAANEPVVLMNGLGGIGKTTVAMAYVNHPDFVAAYDRLAWVTIAGPLEENLLNQLADSDLDYHYNPELDTAGNLKHLVNTLRHLKGNNLLVIDNANSAEELQRVQTRIEASGWKALVTSRAKPSGYQVLELEHLEPAEALALFYRYFDREQNDAAVLALLEVVEYHTLLTELLAKAARNNPVLTLDALEKLMRTEGAKAERLQVDVDPGHHAKSHDADRTAKLHNYVLAMFELEEKEFTEVQLRTLRCLSVLPSTWQEGTTLLQWFGAAENEAEFFSGLRGLVQQGWAQQEGSRYKMHPLLQVVVRAQLQPDAQNCAVLLGTFEELLNSTPYENPLEKQVWLPWAEMAAGFLKGETEAAASLAAQISVVYWRLGNGGKALKYDLIALAIFEAVLSGDHPDLATSYNNVAATYRELGKPQKALEYNLKALAIFKAVLPANHPDLASSYANVAVAYGELGEHEQRLEYNLKAIAIREAVLPENHPSLARSYNNVAATYYALADYAKANEFQLKSLAIREAVLPENHPDLGTSHHNLALGYVALGRLPEAMHHIDKAVEILTIAYPDGHRWLDVSLEAQARIARKLGQG